METITNFSDDNLPVTIYSLESPLANPVKLIREILRDIWRSRELSWILFTRDLKAQYRQSYLGYVWLIIPMISTTIVWMFLNSSQVIQVAPTKISYPAYVMLGSLIWVLLTSCINQPLASFQAGQGVFMKLNVPPEAFMIAGMSKIVFDLILRLIVLIPLFLFLNVVPATTFWLFPVGLIATMIVGTAIGYALIPLGSLYHDVRAAVNMALGFGMYLTPVVYPPPASGWAKILIESNPITSLIMVTRDWLTVGHSDYFVSFTILSLLSIIMLFIAMIVFRVALPHLIERMGM
jgi:lipopolysaccharide transport system permease protein